MDKHQNISLAEEKRITRENAIAQEYGRLKNLLEIKDNYIFGVKLAIIFLVGFVLFAIIAFENYGFELERENSTSKSGLYYEVCVIQPENKTNFQLFQSDFSELNIEQYFSSQASFIKLASFKSIIKAKFFHSKLKKQGFYNIRIVPKYENRIISVKRAKELATENLKKLEQK